MEKMALTSIFFPCKDAENGCRDVYLYANKAKHEEECKFRRYKCPYYGVKGCKFQGSLDQVLPHIESSILHSPIGNTKYGKYTQVLYRSIH